MNSQDGVNHVSSGGAGSDGRRTEAVINELILNSTIEFSSGNIDHIAEAKEFLPYGMNVYVPSLPRQALQSTLDRLRALSEAGFSPVPHLAARRIASRDVLRRFLRRAVRDCGVKRVLLIGGDIAAPVGPYADSSAILKEGILLDAGVHDIGIAGYPEGHNQISMQDLHDTLLEKLALISGMNLFPYIVTQFSFAPVRITEYCGRLARIAPGVPLYIGMAGPTRAVDLIRYAKSCGVSTSLRALDTLGFKAVHLIIHTRPDEQLNVLVNYYSTHEGCNIAGMHIFSFGGFAESARWMHKHYNVHVGEHSIGNTL